MSTETSDLILDVPPELFEAWEQHPQIVKYGEPVLRQVARPVQRINTETQKLLKKMIETMREANGLGLAAPQVGVSQRIIVYDARDGDGLRVLINPKIMDMSGEQFEPKEGCLSIPGLQGTVKRALLVRVKAYDERNRPVSIRAKGLEARVIQHEIDHLDGILFLDRAEPDTLEWALGDDDDDEEGNEEPDATRE